MPVSTLPRTLRRVTSTSMVSEGVQDVLFIKTGPVTSVTGTYSTNLPFSFRLSLNLYNLLKSEIIASYLTVHFRQKDFTGEEKVHTN